MAGSVHVVVSFSLSLLEFHLVVDLEVCIGLRTLRCQVVSVCVRFRVRSCEVCS